MTKKRDVSLLLPDRHPQLDFFLCDIFDAVPKSDTASMAYPLFTLATKPDHRRRRFEHGNRWIEVAPSPRGRATVHDRDLLIYFISQCMAALNAGREVKRTLRFHPHHLLQVTNRQTSGEGYKGLQAALERLQGTQIQTNITTGGIEQWDVFSFIDRARTIKESREGRMIELEVVLSDWIFNAIRATGGDILTIHRDYFRLRKPLERRLYELARKCCGRNPEWRFTVQTLHERTGSASTRKEFRRMLSKIIEAHAKHKHIPDYDFRLENDLVVITPRESFLLNCPVGGKKEGAGQSLDPKLSTATYESARGIVHGARMDIYALEADWRAKVRREGIPQSPDGAFIGYVKAVVGRRK